MQENKGWLEKPAAILAFICLLQGVMWTLAPGLTHWAPPLDVVESYLWGREWVWATFKHPSLPGWALETSYLLTGAAGWPAYLVSQLMIVACFALVYLLGRDLFGHDRRGSQLALAGVLLLTGVYYYSLSTPEFNHNVAQMPFYAAVILALWRAVTRGGLIWWALLGLASAFGIQAKYSFGVLLAVAGLWLIVEPRARRQFLKPGPWLALAIFLIGAAPQIRWLIDSHFLPLTYAAKRAGAGSSSNPLSFLLAQLADHAGLIVLAALAGLFGQFWTARKLEIEFAGLDPFASRFLLTFALGPVLLSALLALIARTGMKDMWAMPMFNLSGLLLVALTAGRFDERALRRLIAGAVVLLIAVPIGYAASVAFADSQTKKPLGVSWPQAAMSQRFSEIWQGETHRPLRIVAGDVWTAGLVALSAPDRPSIFTEADPTLSPWITPDRLAGEGALVVWQDKGERPPARLAEFIAQAPQHTEEFAWPDNKDRPPLRIGYAIVPPAPSVSGSAVSHK
jgi:4-amino-4-deoxy-L-arabinose transferase-like glycosyltransferase